MKRFLAILLLLGSMLVMLASEGQGQIIPQAYYRMTGDLTTGLSLRFRSAGPAHLLRTPSSAGNQQIFTISLWAKPGASIASGGPYTMVGAGSAVANRFLLSFISNTIFAGPSISGTNYLSQTAALFRDPTAWYHIVLAVDTTQAVANNRMLLWVNGKAISFASAVTIPQNATLQFMGTVPHTVGISSYGGEAYDGYLTDIIIVDGQQTPASSFGTTDSNGIWVPQTYFGSYGTNGSRLAFSDTSAATAAALGKDTSGRGNNWTPNNISVTAGTTFDAVADFPKLGDDGANGLGNYATWNPLHRSLSYVANPADGNLYISNGSSASTWPGMGGTMAVNSGKWYYEFYYSGAGSLASSFVGFAESDITMDADITDQPTKIGGWLLRNDSGGLGEAYYNFSGPASFGGGADAPASGTVMLALDMDNNKFWVGRGGTWFGGGNPATNSGGISFSAGKTLMPYISPCCITGGGAVYVTANFGQQPFTYTRPTGFKALNTYNLPNPVIANPATYMKIVTYTGNGSYQSIGDPVKLAGSKQLANSMRFRAAASTHLSRVPASNGNLNKFTLAFWMKKTSLSTQDTVIGATNDGNNFAYIRFAGGTQFHTRYRISGVDAETTWPMIFNDPAAWHHITYIYDRQNTTAADRQILYVDGVRMTPSSSANPTTDLNSWNTGSRTMYIGYAAQNTVYLDSYMADMYFLDGQAAGPTSFGEYDANGNWVAKATTGLTYGTNGFHLDFSDADIVAGARSGFDSSGNNNHWSPNYFSLPSTGMFAAGSSTYLNRTGTAGNRQRWTWSGWVKRGSPGSAQGLFTDGATSFTSSVFFDAADKIGVYVGDPGTSSGSYGGVSTAAFNSLTDWYHIVWAVDTTQATQAQRNRLYVNGTEVTSFASPTYPAQNFNAGMNNSSVYQIGRNTSSNPWHFNGYMSDVHYVDGQQLIPADFAQTVSSKWVPKPYTGTYGTNGFRLNFSNKLNAATLGADSSGNNNNFTANNMSASFDIYDDILRDTPTPYNDGTYDHGNFATLNPLFVQTGGIDLGNLRITGASNNQSVGTQQITVPTYFEVTFDSIDSSNGYPMAGVARRGTVLSAALHLNTNVVAIDRVKNVYRFGSGTGTLSGTAFASGDICQIAFDPITGKLWFGRNGAWLGSGDPAAGANPAATGLTENDYFPVVSASATQGATASINFGQRPFAYTPPAGFKSLNTFNIANTEFVPDLVITKNRSAAVGWAWYDRLRGSTLDLDSSSAAAQAVASTGLLSFQNGGFTAGSSTKFNTSAQNYVSYMFKEGATPGFDIVTYTGNGSTQTVNHVLSKVPALMIFKRLDSAGSDWAVYHQSLGADKYLLLNSTIASTTNTNYWNNTVPTTTNFSVGAIGDVNTNSAQYVAYLFSEVPGFSKIGSYTGNGSADGTFVYTGFKPALVMIKASSFAGSNWRILDYARNPVNPLTQEIYPSLANAEATFTSLDFTANGFKIRSSDNVYNGNGSTYIYIAFAEKPFKYTNAR